MEDTNTVTPELLCAFVDNELDEKDQARVVKALRQDTELAAQYAELVHLKSMISAAYKEPPLPQRAPSTNRPGLMVTGRAAALAGLMVSLGIMGGWIAGNQHAQPDGTYLVQSVADLDPLDLTSDKVLLHINTANHEVINGLLDKTEMLLEESRRQNHQVHVELVANSSGLSVLREGSAFADRIRVIKTRHGNISFLACGIAKRNASVKEGREVRLLPETRVIPAAMDQVFKRTQTGWTYIRT